MLTDLNLSPNFQSDFLSDDDDLGATPLAISHTSKPANLQPVSTQISQVSSYLRKIESDVFEECNQIINQPTQEALAQKSIFNYEYYTVYFHCPICLNSGFKTIQHIKQCAHKNLISPKDVISLLRQCPKTQRQKFASNTKITRVKKEKTKADKSFEMFLLDRKYKEELIQKRVSKLMATERLCKRIFDTDNLVFSILPHSWKLSHLANGSNEYVIDEFSKYFNKASSNCGDADNSYV